MRLARSLEVADKLTKELERFLQGYLPGTTVTRTYTPFVDDAAFETAIGNAKAMLVFVVPLRKSSAIETRGEDSHDYLFRILFVEKCTTAGLPSTEWMDLRVSTVEAAEDWAGDVRTILDPTSPDLRAQESEIDLIFWPDAHATEGVFWSVWNLTLREMR